MENAGERSDEMPRRLSPRERARGLDSRRTFLWRLACTAGAWGVSGMTSVLGAPAVHIVRRGDTLSEIAAQHGIALSKLRELNGLQTDKILPGQQLRLGGEPAYPLLAAVRGQITISNLQPSKWRHIVMHHSATANGNAAIFDRYHRHHRRMENGLAYHFIVGNGTDSADGEIEVGDRWRRQIQGGARSESCVQRELDRDLPCGRLRAGAADGAADCRGAGARPFPEDNASAGSADNPGASGDQGGTHSVSREKFSDRTLPPAERVGIFLCRWWRGAQRDGAWGCHRGFEIR